MGNPGDKIVRRDSLPSLPNQILASGERARYSGIYRFEHASGVEHGIPEEVFVPKGLELPLCRQCGSTLQFALIRQVDNIFEDPDFQ